MSILIKGMEMPKYGCDNCFLRTENYCGRIKKNESVVEYARKNERHPDCPLVHVPPHGRLVDADRLLSERMKRTYYHLPNGDTAIPIIDVEHAPTIIQASEEET